MAVDIISGLSAFINQIHSVSISVIRLLDYVFSGPFVKRVPVFLSEIILQDEEVPV